MGKVVWEANLFMFNIEASVNFLYHLYYNLSLKKHLRISCTFIVQLKKYPFNLAPQKKKLKVCTQMPFLGITFSIPLNLLLFINYRG